jgi:hypothetical protein
MVDNLFSHPTLSPLMTGEELASLMRYDGVTSAFRDWLRRLSIKPVPGRNGIYDPRHVRHQLDLAQGIIPPAKSKAAEKPMSKTEERRHRRGEQ